MHGVTRPGGGSGLKSVDKKGSPRKICKYRASKPLTRGDSVMSDVLSGLEISLDEIFPDMVEEPDEGYGMEMQRL